MSGAIKLTIYNDIVNSIVENKGCPFKYLQIGKYDNERCLETIERTTYTVNENIIEEQMKSDNADKNIYDNDYRVLVRI